MIMPTRAALPEESLNSAEVESARSDEVPAKPTQMPEKRSLRCTTVTVRYGLRSCFFLDEALLRFLAPRTAFIPTIKKRIAARGLPILCRVESGDLPSGAGRGKSPLTAVGQA